MRFSIFFLVVLVVLATVTKADSFSALTGRRIPVKLHGTNKYDVKCSPISNECGCW